MAKANEIDTPSKRSRLSPRPNPYWIGVSGGRGGVSLGYRKTASGAGRWIAKAVLEKQRVEERIGEADDDGAPPGSLTYRAAVAAALEWSVRQQAVLDARRGNAGATTELTVRSAVEAYAAARKRRSAKEGRLAEGRLKRHVLSDEKLASVALAKLRASRLETWRSGLPVYDDPEEKKPGQISPATVNRILGDLRAALNNAAEKHRRELPGHLPLEIKVGTRAISLESNARKQILSEAQVASAINAAAEIDEDFGLLVLLAAATGARHSQLARIRVCDLQVEALRVMVPGSKKGRAARAKAPVAIPLDAEVIARLSKAAEGRAPEAPLLLRWSYRRAGRLKWEKDARRPWGPAYEIDALWAATITAAGLPKDSVFYALRHSSIVRGLRAGLPVRLVAAQHDTSVEMIEKHYSAHIVDATEDLLRKSTLSI